MNRTSSRNMVQEERALPVLAWGRRREFTASARQFLIPLNKNWRATPLPGGNSPINVPGKLVVGNFFFESLVKEFEFSWPHMQNRTEKALLIRKFVQVLLSRQVM